MAVKVTRCPHCQTSFRVREEQLSTAQGMVRCGSCLQVFKAEDYFQADNLSDASATPRAQKKTATKATNTATLTKSDEVELIHDDMDEDQGSVFIEDDPNVDFSLVNLEKGSYKKTDKKTELHIDTSVFDGYSSDSLFHDFSDDSDDDDSNDDEAWAAALLDDGSENDFTEESNADAGQHFTNETSFNSEREGDDFQGFLDDDDLDDHFSVKPNSPVINVAGLQAEPLSLGSTSKIKIQWGWITGILIMLLIAAAQVLYFNFDAWARSPQWRPFYSQLCHYANCDLPKVQNINNMSTQHLVVQTHPKFKGALMVDTLLYNKADYMQPFPDLLLVFRDINERVIASRRFSPKQYISGEIAGQSDMLPKSHTHIALEIVDPGPEAVSYHIDLLANH